ncbi:hypothetical protein EW14_1514 [Prochlorococcus sp. MIT 0604]|nr:hypothetical protein EW14_1514 [Prochlorococcus sp. MIT 0604]
MKKEIEILNKSNLKFHLENLNNNGFTILKNKNLIVEKITTDMKLLLYGLTKNTEFEFDPITTDLHEITKKIGIKKRSLIGKFYDTARSILSTIEVASDNEINSIAKGYMNSDNLLLQINDQIMRIDLPGESERYLGDCDNKEIAMLLPWHQDYPYNQGSQKSLTIYVPLQSGDLNSGGTLEVAIQSHKDGMVEHNFDQETATIGEKEIKGISYKVPTNIINNFKTKVLYLDFSDILIFDMDLIHRSVPNNSGKARFNLQVRLSDLNDEEFCKRYSTIKTKFHLNLNKKEQSFIKGI